MKNRTMTVNSSIRSDRCRAVARRVIPVVAALVLAVCVFCVPAFATGDVSGVIEDTWGAAKGQLQDVVDNVVFPVLDVSLAILFFVKIGTTYFDYKKHGQVEFTAPAILFASLIFTLTAPMYIWNII